MKVELGGKVALVTGAARGIGKAIGDVLASNGATVIYSDRDTSPLDTTGALPTGSRAAALDVTDAAGVASAISEIERIDGRLDILVNNAGVNTLAHRVPLDQFPAEEWDRIISVDLTAVFTVSKAALPLLLEDGGRIINIGSVLGLVPARLQCAFIAAKAGVVNLTRAMALEYGGRGVLVNAIAPGSILTDTTNALFYGSDGQFKASVQEMLAHIPLGRPGSSAEIASAALFLAAPESSYINGHVLTVDGGWTAGYLRPF